MTTLQDAAAQMRACGMPEFPPGHPHAAGKVVRYGPKKTAWYVLHEYRLRNGQYVVVGAFGQWGQIEKLNIEVDWKSMSAEDAAALQARKREAEAREREKTAERQQHAANRAREQWRAASTAGVDSHPYVLRKQVRGEGLRQFSDGTLLVPAWRWDAETDASRIVGLQKILPDGQKRFTKNMAKEGAACRIGPVPQEGQTILLAEGFATAGSVRLADEGQHTVFVAFDAGNIMPVVAMLRTRYPASPLVICADDDWKTMRPNGEPWNPGLDYASRAAIAHGAWVAAPVFPSAAEREAAYTAGDKWTDFNDLHVRCGVEHVRAQIRDAIAAAEGAVQERAAGISTAPMASAGGAANVVLGPWEQGAGPPVPPIEAYVEDEVGKARATKAKKSKPRPGPKPDDPQWMWRVQYGRDGPKSSVHNGHLYLTNDEGWQGVLGYDQFSECVVKLKPPPWGGRTGEWDDMDDNRLLLWLSTRIGEPSNDAIAKAVMLAAHENAFNPVTEKFDALVWDKVPRLQTWLIDWCHVLKSRRAEAMDAGQLDRLRQYAEIIGPRWLLGAVARAYRPGCQMDNMLILESEGGFRKSTLFRALGGQWFTDARLNFQDKDSLMILQGRLIIEMAELEGMNKAEDSETKRFITVREDLFRMPYGRRLVKMPRRCVFSGTVNYDVYLKDDTGNRRFWPIQTGGPVDIEAFQLIVDQLWAEAVQWFKDGERWHIEPHEKALIDEQQEDRFLQDAWEGRVRRFLDGTGEFNKELPGKRWDSVTQDDIMSGCLHIDVARRDRQAAIRVGKILKRIGWSRHRDSGDGRGYYYVRPDDDGLPPSRKPLEGQEDVNKEGDGGNDLPF